MLSQNINPATKLTQSKNSNYIKYDASLALAENRIVSLHDMTSSAANNIKTGYNGTPLIDTVYNFAQKFPKLKYIDPMIIADAVVAEARTLVFNPVIFNLVAEYYVNKLDTNMHNIYTNAPAFFTTHFLEDPIGFEIYQKYYYLICFIKLISDKLTDEQFQASYNLSDINAWVNSRRDPNIDYIIIGPTENTVFDINYEEHYAALISSSTRMSDIVRYQQLTTAQTTSKDVLGIMQFLQHNPNVYYKNPDEAKKYTVNIDSARDVIMSIDANKNLIFDCGYVDFGDTREQDVAAKMDDIDITVKPAEVESRIATKKMERIFQQYSRIRIAECVVHDHVFITSLDIFPKVFIVFQGVSCGERNIYNTVTNNDLKIGGHFKRTNRGYEFIQDTDAVTYKSSKTRVSMFRIFISIDPSTTNVIIPSETPISFHKTNIYQHPYAVNEYKTVSDDQYMVRLPVQQRSIWHEDENATDVYMIQKLIEAGVQNASEVYYKAVNEHRLQSLLMDKHITYERKYNVQTIPTPMDIAYIDTKTGTINGRGFDIDVNGDIVFTDTPNVNYIKYQHDDNDLCLLNLMKYNGQINNIDKGTFLYSERLGMIQNLGFTLTNYSEDINFRFDTEYKYLNQNSKPMRSTGANTYTFVSDSKASGSYGSSDLLDAYIIHYHDEHAIQKNKYTLVLEHKNKSVKYNGIADANVRMDEYCSDITAHTHSSSNKHDETPVQPNQKHNLYYSVPEIDPTCKLLALEFTNSSNLHDRIRFALPIPLRHKVVDETDNTKYTEYYSGLKYGMNFVNNISKAYYSYYKESISYIFKSTMFYAQAVVSNGVMTLTISNIFNDTITVAANDNSCQIQSIDISSNDDSITLKPPCTKYMSINENGYKCTIDYSYADNNKNKKILIITIRNDSSTSKNYEQICIYTTANVTLGTLFDVHFDSSDDNHSHNVDESEFLIRSYADDQNDIHLTSSTMSPDDILFYKLIGNLMKRDIAYSDIVDETRSNMYNAYSIPNAHVIDKYWTKNDYINSVIHVTLPYQQPFIDVPYSENGLDIDGMNNDIDLYSIDDNDNYINITDIYNINKSRIAIKTSNGFKRSSYDHVYTYQRSLEICSWPKTDDEEITNDAVHIFALTNGKSVATIFEIQITCDVYEGCIKTLTLYKYVVTRTETVKVLVGVIKHDHTKCDIIGHTTDAKYIEHGRYIDSNVPIMIDNNEIVIDYNVDKLNSSILVKQVIVSHIIDEMYEYRYNQLNSTVQYRWVDHMIYSNRLETLPKCNKFMLKLDFTKYSIHQYVRYVENSFVLPKRVDNNDNYITIVDKKNTNITTELVNVYNNHWVDKNSIDSLNIGKMIEPYADYMIESIDSNLIMIGNMEKARHLSDIAVTSDKVYVIPKSTKFAITLEFT